MSEKIRRNIPKKGRQEEACILRSTAVFDSVSDRPRPAALLIAEGTIQEVLPWDYPELSPHTGLSLKDLPLHDFGAHMIMPSFIDAHTHLFTGAIVASELVCNTLGEGKSQEECVRILKEYAEKHPNQERIRGTGWFIGNWEDWTLPDKRSLDAAFPDTPVYLQCADEHNFWLNTKALEEAGIEPDPQMKNGTICTWENGELTGLLMEPAACEPALKKYMDFSDDQMRQNLLAFQGILARNGVAAVSEMSADEYTEETCSRYRILKQLDEEGQLTSDAYIYMKLFGHTDFSEYFKMKKELDSEHVQIAGVKGFLDGVTETHTGLLLEPYEDQPDSCGEGLPLWPPEKMQEEIIAANHCHIQVRLHCIADGSVRMALDLYEKARQVSGDPEVRNTIEHVENIHPDDIARFRELKVIPSMQPYHLIFANDTKSRQIGKARCKYEWPVRSLLQAGGALALGTDCPVVTVNPFCTIHAAVTRKNDVGVQYSQNPWEAIDMATALKCYTAGAAFVYGTEKETGTLEPGKKANILVLDRNLFEIPAEQIEQTQVLANYFEGNLVYQQNSFT